VIVITTVNSLNIRELPEIFNLLEKMGVKNWRLQPVIPIGRVINFCELEMNAHDILELGYFIQNWALQPKTNGLKIICSDGLEYIEGTEMVDRPWRGCPGGWVTCGITSDGKVKGCLSLPDNLIEGDLRKDDLWSIWFNPDSFAYTRHFTPDQLGLNCKSCDKSEVCLGGCSSNSYAAMGSFHNDPYCFYNLNKKLTSTVSGNIPKDGDQTHKICRPPT
jgi:radical SAM protein with 4Fe4S-binding SPASM domain